MSNSNVSASAANTQKSKEGFSMTKIKSIVSRVSSVNESWREYVVTVFAPTAHKLEGTKIVPCNELEFVVHRIFTKARGEMWLASFADVTRKPNGGVFFDGTEMREYGMGCIAKMSQLKEELITTLKADILALESTAMSAEEKKLVEITEEELEKITNGTWFPCEYCEKVDKCTDKKKSMKAVPNVLLYEGAKPYETAALGSSVASVVAKVVNPEFPKGVKASEFAGWQQCSSCKFCEFTKYDTDPTGVDAVTGTITMEDGTPYRRSNSTMDKRQDRDTRAKDKSLYCTLDEKDVANQDACDRYVWNNYQSMLCDNESVPVAFADNVIVSLKDDMIRGTMAYAVDPTQEVQEEVVVLKEETKDKGPGFIPTPYNSGTFLVLHDEIRKAKPNILKAMASVEFCENRKNDDDKYFTYLNVKTLEDKAENFAVSVKDVTKLPDEMMVYVLANLEKIENPVVTSDTPIVQKLRTLLPKNKETEEELAEKRLKAVMSKRTYVKLDLDADFTEEELAITKPCIKYTANTDPSTRWLLADFFVLSKEGNRIKGNIKKVRGELKLEVTAGYLSREELGVLTRMVFSRYADKVKKDSGSTMMSKVQQRIKDRMQEATAAATKS